MAALVSSARPDASFVILTPIWQRSLGESERRSLIHTTAINQSVDKFFIAPEGLATDFYREHFPDWRIRFFDPRHFVSVRSYSRWLTQPDLYRSVSDYEFMVMCQLDGILLRGIHQLPIAEWDYLGAPWKPAVRFLKFGQRAVVATSAPRREGPWWVKLVGGKISVGNGGLSVRRVSAMIRCSEALMDKYREALRTGLLEDLYFSALGPSVGLRVADEDVAGRVFAESTAAGLVAPGEFFGFHGLAHVNPELLRSIIGR